ncbi:GDSL-type esterase/lipase family protein [Salibacterium qingdaonense]|uniref:Lysophospholipase L1 n=1 Tax=Salibacterium qingdaonense TaxID=266892 RepID=A0A1I4LDQ0_9BACI|nr:GDSL-type esterase/lipase family protein [Salibacterium qingdaonense]SFL89122.1 Lysophospholipase L1 [Salibacterium qingdaonense]
MRKRIFILLGLAFLLMLPSGAWFVSSSLSDAGSDHALSDSAANSSKTQQTDSTVSSSTDTPSREDDKRPFEQGIQDAVASVVNETRSLFISSDLHITAVGDSLTKGTGDSSGSGGYVGILKDSLEKSVPDASIRVQNYGKKGNRSDQILERLNKPNISSSISESDIILLTVGANDIMKIVRSNVTDLTYEVFEKEKDPYEQRLTSIFEQIREENEDAAIYLLGLYNPFNMYFSDIPELDQIITDWNMIGRNVVNEQENAVFIPVRDIFQYAGPGYYSEDNFHPNQRGYASMADRVLDYIEPDLEEYQNGTNGENSND